MIEVHQLCVVINTDDYERNDLQPVKSIQTQSRISILLVPLNSQPAIVVALCVVSEYTGGMSGLLTPAECSFTFCQRGE